METRTKLRTKKIRNTIGLQVLPAKVRAEAGAQRKVSEPSTTSESDGVRTGFGCVSEVQTTIDFEDATVKNATLVRRWSLVEGFGQNSINMELD